MDLSELRNRQFYRFTGPPEHWLTALKYWTWGLETHHRSSWSKVNTGDIFFIHSTGPSKSSLFSNAASGIIGIGVVGFNFSIKDNFLWHYEIKNNENRWPLLVPLAEMYLFSEVPDPNTWESPTPNNDEKTFKLIDKLVENRIPISSIRGFPQMGSFSKVSSDVAAQIFAYNRSLHVYSGHSTRGRIIDEKPSDLTEVHDISETMRYTASLRFIEDIKKRLIVKPYSLTIRDNDILARADNAHQSVLKELLDIFRKKGYDTYFNEFVDLFAHDGRRSFLIEVKSTENKNFRVQARRGIAQLFEYDYFDISKFKKENDLSFKDQFKILTTSKEPRDMKYVDFINSLDLGVATVESGTLKPVGKDLGFSEI